MKRLLIILALGAGVCAPGAALAQVPASAQVVSGCGTPYSTYTAGQIKPLTQDTTGSQCSVATASIAGFRPSAYGTPITATTGGATGTLPAGAEVVATNVGTTYGAYCALGASVTSSAQYIAPNGGWFAFGISGDTQLTCEGVGGTTTINMAGGSGLPTGTGGGGGGSSSNASVGSTGSAVPGSGTYLAANVGGNLSGLAATANGLKVDPSAVTQPISAASLPLPSGASTSANQPSNAAQNSAAAGQTGTLIQGVATSAAPSYTTAHTDPISLDLAGNTRVNCVTGCSSGSTSNASSGVATSSTNNPSVAYNYVFNGTTWDQVQDSVTTGALDINVKSSSLSNQSVNTTQVNSTTVLTGAGATGTGSQRNTVAQDQTTIAGATPGRTYNTIAASQTAQALTGGGGGATGDYLSFCVVIPTSTSPGVVTIKDSSTTVYAFPGGSSSLSNLVPFTIPVGSVSVSGAWTVTTGANLSVVCTGKFT
jgi:hypothetical protein